MPVQSLYQEATRLRDRGLDVFYAPQFEVRVEGAGLPRDVLRDVIQLTYHDNVKEIDGFEIVVNNWDSKTNTFKYIGAETPQTLQNSAEESARYRLFEPCQKKVEVHMGYVGDMRLMLTGNFTTMEPSFTSGGAPTLSVRGLNVLHRLRCKQYSDFWVDKSESEIAESIALRRDQETNGRRFPLAIRIDGRAKNKETAIEYVAQENQYDIDFLFNLARRLSYVVVVREEDTDDSDAEKYLYFGPSQSKGAHQGRNVTFELAWGKSLIDFKPTLTTASQVASVEVSGWNRRTRSRIRQRVGLDHDGIRFNEDLFRLIRGCETMDEMGCERGEIVTREPVHTEREAELRALGLLRERLKEMVTASGSTVGLTDLRAGQQVAITGVGSRLGGTYFVTETTHTISDSGYVTSFKARREDPGEGQNA